mgnify:CR=1 FL=1
MNENQVVMIYDPDDCLLVYMWDFIIGLFQSSQCVCHVYEAEFLFQSYHVHACFFSGFHKQMCKWRCWW